MTKKTRAIRNLIGTVIVMADVLFAAAGPAIVRNLHHETSAHMWGAVATYAVLLLATLWVIRALIKDRARAARMPRPSSYGRYGGGL